MWPDKTRAVVAQEHVAANGDEVQQMPFTSDAKRVLERSLREAIRLGHNYVGTEHLLLGLLREEDCAGFRVVQELAVDVEELRELTLQLISTRPERRTMPHAPDVAAAPTAPRTPRGRRAPSRSSYAICARSWSAPDGPVPTHPIGILKHVSKAPAASSFAPRRSKNGQRVLSRPRTIPDHHSEKAPERPFLMRAAAERKH